MKNTLSLFILSYLLISSLFVEKALGDTVDRTRGEVEVYGKASFLLRINDQHSFHLKVDDHAEGGCVFDIAGVTRALENVMHKRGRKIETNPDAIAHFTMHFEYFGTIDGSGHCLFGYEIGLERNNLRNDDAGELIKQYYDYDNSYPLMKLSGLLHVEESLLDEYLQNEVDIATNQIFYVLDDLRSKISSNQKDKS